MGQTIPLEPKEPKKKDVTRACYTVFCCQGSDCVKAGAKETMKSLRSAIREAGLKNQVHIIKTQCADKCKEGPVVIACSACGHGPCGAVWYRAVEGKDAETIVREHLQQGKPVKSKLFPSKSK
jgi:(2Fe-2S) ferredoxin